MYGIETTINLLYITIEYVEWIKHYKYIENGWKLNCNTILETTDHYYNIIIMCTYS